MSLRFVDQEDSNQPTQTAGLYSPTNQAPLTSEQANPNRQFYEQQQQQLQNNPAPSINLQRDVDHSTPRLQRIRQLLQQEDADPFFKERFYDELTEETLA